MSFNPSRLKVQLKLAVTRLKLLQQKKTGTNNAARREVAQLLEKGKEESARIRVEHIIREELNVEAMEILELYCELLLARFGLIESMKHCDQAVAEAVNTIIYAAPRTDVKELALARDQLIAKYGREFALAAMDNRNEVVNSRIVQKLKIQTPDPILVDQYLKEIANAYNVAWHLSSGAETLDLETSGSTSMGTTTQDLGAGPKATAKVLDFAAGSSDGDGLNRKTVATRKPAEETEDVSSPGEPDFDELTKRFERLKQRRQ